MKNFLKKYVKFNGINVNIILCVTVIIINICTGNYCDIVGWLVAFCAYVSVAFMENWNNELLDERFELENKLTNLCIKNIVLDCNKEHSKKDIELLKQCSLEEITHLKNVVLKMQEENERLHKLLNELKNK
jgi:hypothetical protein